MNKEIYHGRLDVTISSHSVCYYPELSEIISNPMKGGPSHEYGGRVMGSFISAQLDNATGTLSDEAMVCNQIQLLLTWCFSQKITHLQRTIPPSLIDT